jgi:phosphopantetheinyl transferase
MASEIRFNNNGSGHLLEYTVKLRKLFCVSRQNWLDPEHLQVIRSRRIRPQNSGQKCLWVNISF